MTSWILPKTPACIGNTTGLPQRLSRTPEADLSMTELELNEHQLLALWAAECAERVAFLFSDLNPEDDRPILAIQAARDWVAGNLAMTLARKAAMAAHAAAREAPSESACFSARAAGHAAATPHVADHAKHAANYAIKAVWDKDAERNWQAENLPPFLHRRVLFGLGEQHR